MKKLKHSNVVKFLGSKDLGAFTYIALELCSGSLADVIRANPNGLINGDLVQMMMDLVLGFGYLVDSGVHHGDIKPHNILVDANGLHKFADFGLSQMFEAGINVDGPTGTPEYSHPFVYELLCWARLHPGSDRPHRSYPPTVDLWSLAATFYHAANGTRPFVSLSTQTMFKVRCVSLIDLELVFHYNHF